MKLIKRLVITVLLILLPFITLIRGAVYIHEEYQLFAWFCLLFSGIFTLIILTLYLAWLFKRIKGKQSTGKEIKRISIFVGLLLLAFCIKGLLFLSPENVKHNEIQSEFLSLHPVLRLSVSTLIFIDKDMIITDASRMPEDYKKMGLKSIKNSLHYPQSDGYVHAIDIRTNYRSEFRNKAIKSYFRIMGFNTLRHGGTADHLHVSLQSHDRPWAK